MSNPELEDAIWATLAAEEERRKAFAATATPEQATRVGQLHNQYPSLAGGVKLSAGKANLTDEMVKQIAIKSVPISVDKKVKPKKSWFERNVMDKVKTASRYTFAGLEFIPQTVQGGAAQIFDKNDDVNGWFISTDLGSLIANDDEAGTGFFIGGRAKELQSDRAKRYRGEINGNAFTTGRGLASTFLEPNTLAYRLLSGAVDAAMAIATPSIPLAGAVGKAARVLDEGGDASKGLGLVGKGLSALNETETGSTAISKVADISRTVGKGSKEIGLTKLNAAKREELRKQVGLLGEAVDIEQSNRFFTTGFGRRIIERTAETTDFAETHKLWEGKLDPSTTMRLAKANTEQQVMAELLDVLGTEVTNIAGIKGGRRAYYSLAQRNALIKGIPFGPGVSRAFAKMPTHNINLFNAETPRDQIQQIDTVDRALKLFKADPAKRTDFINRAGELVVSKDEVKIKKFYDDLTEEVKEAMVRNGTPRELADSLYKKIDEYTEGAKGYTADKLGYETDDGAYRTLHGLPEDADARVFAGGTLTSEFGRHEFFIPDPKQVRRLTNRYNWLWVKKDPNLANLEAAGNLRLPLAAAEAFQEQVWRKYITATVGNFVRNTVDSQISIGLSGKAGAASPFLHPFQWMSFVAFNKGKGDLLGQDWNTVGSVENLGEALMDYRRTTGDIVAAYYKDPLAARRRAQRLGQFSRYERRLDKVDNAVARAHGDEIGRLNADWSTRRLAEGKSVEELTQLIKDGDKEAVQWFNTVKSRAANGMEVWDAPSQSMVYEKIDLDIPGNLKRWMEANHNRLQRVTGSNPELLDVVAQGRLTKRLEQVGPNDKILGELKVGGRVEVTTSRKINGKVSKDTYVARVVGVTDTAAGSTYTVEPFAFDGLGDNTSKLESLLQTKDIYMAPGMPRYVVGEIRNPDTPAQNQLIKSMDRMLEAFHGYLYTKPIATLERSPAFRSIYYDWVDKLSISLDEKSLNKIIDDISSRVDDPENYLTPGLWNKLQDFKANPDKLYGTLNADEVSSFASASSLDEYKKTFYNAVERRNGTDVMRLISPFAQQQAEFLGRMARFFTVPVAGGSLGYLPNTQNLRKMQLIVEGGRDADPDGDGRGFFFKDPTTGNQSFSIPLTGNLTKMVTGVNAQLTAPLKGISPGFDVRPGFGPVMTLTNSAILRDVPSNDWIRKIVLPYGERNKISDAFTPTWVTKIYDGISGESNGRFFANTYAETMQALASTGKYDLDNANDRDRLLEESREKARFLVVLRGVSQFTGPAAGDFDIKVATEQGDVHTTGLAAALQSLRENNYDTANLRFIEIFGEDAFTYLSNKTTSEAGGLGASKQFGDFERSNTGLFRKYKEIAGFFGPTGTEFDFEVYTRQLLTGKRRRLTPEEMLKASEKAIGLAYYRDMKEHLGTKLNQAQRDYLANYKEQIISKYPGFGEMNFDPNKTERDIGKLFEAAKTEKLQDNGVAKAVQYYEKIRNAALEEAINRGYKTLKSADLADLHQYIASYAEVIIEETPDFAKVYDRLLSQEIE
jgi:hypothetical protein